MKKEELNFANDVISCLKGEKLRYVMRAGSMGDFGFGDVVDVEQHGYDENKNKITTTRKLPLFILHIDGRFRISCGDDIILSKNDMFNPSTKIVREPSFDWDAWATAGNDGWDVKGNNRYDEICGKNFNDEPFEFTIKKVTISKWGDLKIEFGNGFTLETFVDESRDEECWRFFTSNSNDKHLIITGAGIGDNTD